MGDGSAEATVVVDHAVCVGIGQCELLAPAVFRVDDEGVAVVVGTGRLADDLARRVVEACPSGAITIVGP